MGWHEIQIELLNLEGSEENMEWILGIQTSFKLLLKLKNETIKSVKYYLVKELILCKYIKNKKCKIIELISTQYNSLVNFN